MRQLPLMLPAIEMPGLACLAREERRAQSKLPSPACLPACTPACLTVLVDDNGEEKGGKIIVAVFVMRMGKDCLFCLPT